MALDLGFCDEILYQNGGTIEPDVPWSFSLAAIDEKVVNNLLAKVKAANAQEEVCDEQQEPEATSVPNEAASPEAEATGVQGAEPEGPSEPEHPEGEEGPEPPENTEPRGASADSLIQRLNRLKYNF